MAQLVVVGRIGGPHGVRGEVRIHSSTVPPENILDYRPWYLGSGDPQSAGFAVAVVEGAGRRGQGLVARFEGCGDRDAAARLTGQLIAVPREVLPPPDEEEYYWQDLVGLDVMDQAGCCLGKVRALLATGAHDVLVVADGRRETLIPFAEAFVRQVDLEAGRLVVDWQEPV